VDLLGVVWLGLVALEWLGLGWLSGVDWPDACDWWLGTWPLRLLVGAFLIGAAMLLLSAVGVGFANPWLVLAVAALAAALMRWGTRGAVTLHVRDGPVAKRLPEELTLASETHSREGRRRWGGDRRWELGGWLTLGGILVAATIRSFLVPEAGWDAYSHWGLRAMGYALAGDVVNVRSAHEYYPPLVPFLEAWLYLQRGSVTIDLAKTEWALIGVAFAICLAAHLRAFLPKPWQAPWFTAAILASTTALLESFWTGQADLPLAAFVTLAALAAVRWQGTRQRAWLVQVAIFAAAAALTKFEGFPRIVVIVVALAAEVGLSRERRLLTPMVVLTAAAGVALVAWGAIAAAHALSMNSEHLGAFQPQALGSVVLTLVAVFGGVRTGGAVVVALLAWLAAGRRLLAPPLRVITLTVIGELLLTLVAFLFSDTPPDVEVRTSATRLFEQFLPLGLFVAAVTLASGAELPARSAAHERAPSNDVP
jgi:hypothetical protein